jgi:hypothetical protein
MYVYFKIKNNWFSGWWDEEGRGYMEYKCNFLTFTTCPTRKMAFFLIFMIVFAFSIAAKRLSDSKLLHLSCFIIVFVVFTFFFFFFF